MARALTVKVGAFPSGAQANIHSVGVVLPKQLPARLTHDPAGLSRSDVRG